MTIEGAFQSGKSQFSQESIRVKNKRSMEFFLNGAELSLNSVNSEKLINP